MAAVLAGLSCHSVSRRTLLIKWAWGMPGKSQKRLSFENAFSDVVSKWSQFGLKFRKVSNYYRRNG